MKTLISGDYDNIGDEAILKFTIISLKKVNPNIEIVLLSNDIKYTEKMYSVRTIN